jgi:coenzyme PQQ synthesis protein D (PqqD)
MSEKASETVYRLADEGLQWRAAQDEILALDLERSEYLGVNRAGAVLWTALAEGADRKALIERLVAAEAVEPERAARDVEQFLKQLREHGLLTEA